MLLRSATAALGLAFLLSTPAFAQTTPPSADFDSLPIGPWFDALVSGAPSNMQVNSTANVATIYPYFLPPGASGNVLRVDNSTSSEDAVLSFAFDCGGGGTESACRLGYSYVGWAQVQGQGLEFHLDAGGIFGTPALEWDADIPGGDWQDSTLGTGMHDVDSCSAQHTFEIVVEAGALLILDNVASQCLAPVPNETRSFGTLKSRFD